MCSKNDDICLEEPNISSRTKQWYNLEIIKGFYNYGIQ
jgi:hypothetical protein